MSLDSIALTRVLGARIRTIYRIYSVSCALGLLGLSGCFGSDPVPEIRSTIHVVGARGQPPLDLIITVANDGPGGAWVWLQCPSFAVVTEEDKQVGPSIGCLAYAGVVQPFRLGPGQVHFASVVWDGIGWGGGYVGDGAYWLIPEVRALTLGKDEVAVVSAPLLVELVP